MTSTLNRLFISVYEFGLIYDTTTIFGLGHG